MKTLRQWEKIWDQAPSGSKASKLLKGYLKPGFFSGVWNRHHQEAVKETLGIIGNKPVLQEPKKFIRFRHKDDKFKCDDIIYICEETYLRTLAERYSQYFDKLKLTDEQENLFNEASDGIKLNLDFDGRGEKTYVVKKIEMLPEYYQKPGYYAVIEQIIRKPQVYDLLENLRNNIGQDTISQHGDLAKILKVIANKTGASIAVKYADFGLDHIAAMAKDFKDTFKAYKPSEIDYYLERDLLQFFHGVKNTTRGTFSLIAVPLIFLRNMLNLIFNTASLEDFWDNGKSLVTQPLEYLIDGVPLLLRGLTQMITAPLTTFIKIPLRSFISFVSPAKILIEEDLGFKKAIDQDSVHEIHRKFEKNKKRGRQTVVDSAKELKFFKAVQVPNDPYFINSSIDEVVEQVGIADYKKLFKV
jgi:hypothetical protein